MKNSILPIVFVFASFVLNAQVNTTANTTAAVAPTTTANSVIATSDYKIGSGDTVQFWIIGDPETNVSVRVSQEGKISLPYIGNISVGGISVSEAKDKIYTLYKPDYYVDPQINLVVTNVTLKIVSFMGTGINKSGPVDIPSDRDLYLLEAISKAGGFSRVGSSVVMIIRSGPKGELVKLKVDTTKIGPKDHKLEPGDIINVGEFGVFDNK